MRTMANARQAATTVVSLTRYRDAMRAAAFLRGCYHDPPWLKKVTVQVDGDGDVRVLVVLLWTTELIERCVPRAVDNIGVTIAVEGRR